MCLTRLSFSENSFRKTIIVRHTPAEKEKVDILESTIIFYSISWATTFFSSEKIEIFNLELDIAYAKSDGRYPTDEQVEPLMKYISTKSAFLMKSLTLTHINNDHIEMLSKFRATDPIFPMLRKLVMYNSGLTRLMLEIFCRARSMTLNNPSAMDFDSSVASNIQFERLDEFFLRLYSHVGTHTIPIVSKTIKHIEILDRFVGRSRSNKKNIISIASLKEMTTLQHFSVEGGQRFYSYEEVQTLVSKNRSLRYLRIQLDKSANLVAVQKLVCYARNLREFIFIFVRDSQHDTINCRDRPYLHDTYKVRSSYAEYTVRNKNVLT